MLSLDMLLAKLVGESKTGDMAFSANAKFPVITYINSHNNSRFFILSKCKSIILWGYNGILLDFIEMSRFYG
jgi:hypothetical protein